MKSCCQQDIDLELARQLLQQLRAYARGTSHLLSERQPSNPSPGTRCANAYELSEHGEHGTSVELGHFTGTNAIQVIQRPMRMLLVTGTAGTLPCG